MINWQRISELEADIGEDEVDEVLSMFLEEISELYRGYCKTRTLRCEMTRKLSVT
jgi:hypothetical protein